MAHWVLLNTHLHTRGSFGSVTSEPHWEKWTKHNRRWTAGIL